MANSRCWAVVPAAGVGSRMQADRPKQYLPLGDSTVIEHTLSRLLSHARIERVVLALAEADDWWPELPVSSEPRIQRVAGGAERADSVLSALRWLTDTGDAEPSDWVLVHDAARPCLRHEDLDHLIAAASAHRVGGLLALPVRDTMKRATAGGEIEQTIDRQQLWHALTPQMFRLGELREALETALAEGALITDEASAMEHAGCAPLLVEGHEDNLKITRPRDLALAELYLQGQAKA